MTTQNTYQRSPLGDALFSFAIGTARAERLSNMLSEVAEKQREIDAALARRDPLVCLRCGRPVGEGETMKRVSGPNGAPAVVCSRCSREAPREECDREPESNPIWTRYDVEGR